MEAGLFTILLFEDDSNDVLLLKRALRKNNMPHQVYAVHDGAEGLKYLMGEAQYADRVVFPFPNMVLLDLKMPKMNGLEVLNWMKQNPAFCVVPTIVLSSSKVPADIRKSYELGANSYLVKPGCFEDLQFMLKSVCSYWDICEKPELRARLSV